MERESSKHGPRLDEEMEEETETIVRSGQPSAAEEWRETELFDPGYLERNCPRRKSPPRRAG